MIPIASIIEWRENSPWILTEQVEQDLILSRILVELYSDPMLKEKIIFRGGTALHKLFIKPPARYSEDVDLVQIKSGPIGPCLNEIRKKLDPWLGTPTWKIKPGRVVLYYSFTSESASAQKMKVKIEINTREHFHHFDPIEVEHAIENTWFSGKANIKVFCLEELLGTKLRALYQRKKGRDLFDLFIAVKSFPQLKTDRIIEVFQRYVSHDGQTISRAEFEANLKEKLSDPAFQGDIVPLLSEDPQYMQHTFLESAEFVLENFISKLPGDPWKGAQKE